MSGPPPPQNQMVVSLHGPDMNPYPMTPTLLKRCTVKAQLHLRGHASFACEVQYLITIVYDIASNMITSGQTTVNFLHIVSEIIVSTRQSSIFCDLSVLSARFHRLFLKNYKYDTASALHGTATYYIYPYKIE